MTFVCLLKTKPISFGGALTKNTFVMIFFFPFGSYAYKHCLVKSETTNSVVRLPFQKNKMMMTMHAESAIE